MSETNISTAVANGTAEKKKWILNAFSMSSPTHVAPGLWRHPDNQTYRYKDIDYWIELAKVLDGNFQGLFLADMLGVYDVYHGPRNYTDVVPGAAQFPLSDPSLPIAAMAAVTKSLSFAVTASTTYESPFIVARRYATLDHLTNGRIAWNVVTSYLPNAAENLGLDAEIPHEKRYEIAGEFLDVFYKLLEGSWRDDAVVRDDATRSYTKLDRVRRIDHKGKHFSVAGPHLVEPSRQRTPFIFQAGASGAGRNFATRHAEAMFLPGMTKESVIKSVREVRAQTAANGRHPQSIKLITSLFIVVDETDELAQKRYEEYLSYADLEGSLALFGGWTGEDLGAYADDDVFTSFSGPGAIQSIVSSFSATVPNSDNVKWTKRRIAQELALGGPHPRAIGSAKTVADQMEKWIDDTGSDGFNVSFATSPYDFQAIIKHLIPEMKARGVFWDPVAAEGQTTRQNYLGTHVSPDGRLSHDHPGSKFRWTKDHDGLKTEEVEVKAI